MKREIRLPKAFTTKVSKDFARIQKKELSNKVMVDPSLLVANRTMETTFGQITRGYEKGFKFFLPNSFIATIRSSKVNTETPVVRFFLHNASASNLGYLKESLQEYSNRIEPFEVQEEHLNKYKKFKESLSEQLIWYHIYRDDPLISVLFEEWVFLQEWSWITSRSKKSFTEFKNAGAMCVESGRKTLEEFVKKTLKKRDIARIDYVRAFAKWTAIGGSSIASFIDPITGALTTAASGYFLLFDP